MKCRACGSRNQFEVLDLGEMPLAGDFRSAGQPNALYPLVIDHCGDCGVLQVRTVVDRSILFNEHYCYASSMVPALVKHFDAYAREVALPPGTRKRLLEVGCNDGVFLGPLKDAGYETVGVDASANVAAMARGRGFDTHTLAFGAEAAKTLKSKHGHFDVITCSNVFAHNPDVEDFLSGVDSLLGPEGEFWVEVQSAHRLLEGLHWSFFYHEHCFYWTIQALTNCLARRSFHLQRYKVTPMHGGSLRAVFSRKKPPIEVPTSEPLLQVEDWQRFRQDSLRNRELIAAVVNALPVEYAYGASGQAVVLINWTGIAGKLKYVVDGSPLRYGNVIPNTRVPIISEDEFFGRRDVNDWCFVTAHTYAHDISEKVRKRFSGRSMKFVTPLPIVAIQ